MLIDGNCNKTLLSTPLPGMLDLTKVLRLNWDEICKEEPNLSNDNKVMITDGDNYYSKVLVEYVQETLDKQIVDASENQIPNFQLDYINFMKKCWIENAILAKFHLQEKQHYLIDNNTVRIINYQNIGVVDKVNTQWQKGLYQFIQFKHYLSITTLRISTNLMSNVGFFKYIKLTLGLTVLSCNTILNLFSYLLLKRLLKQEPGIAISGENEWLEEIHKAVYYQIEKKRVVLIINRKIDDVYQIEDYLKNFDFKTSTYFDNNQQIQKEIEPNAIIIATNLEGRGTDLTPNEELEMNEGLHVIMSKYQNPTLRIWQNRKIRQIDMKMKKMINNDSVSFSSEFQERFYQYLSNQKLNKIMREVVEIIDANCLMQIPNLKLINIKKIIINQILISIEVELIYVVKKNIFESKMQIANQNCPVKLID